MHFFPIAYAFQDALGLTLVHLYMTHFIDKLQTHFSCHNQKTRIKMARFETPY
jgi:hypothetical protein